VNYKITQGLLLYEKITDIKTNFIYITLFVAFQIGIILPTLFADLIEGNKSFPYRYVRLSERVKANRQILKVLLFTVLVGLIGYSLPIIQNPTIIIDALRRMYLPTIQAYIRVKKVGLLSSLFNNALLWYAVCFVSDYHNILEDRKKLLLYFSLITLYSILFSERMYLIYFLIIYVFALEMNGRRVRIVSLLKVILAAVVLIIVIEVFRFSLAQLIMPQSHVDIKVVISAFKLSRDRILIGYLGSDVNNALYMIKWSNSINPLAYTVFDKIFKNYMVGDVGPGLNTGFGTVSLMGIMWLRYNVLSYFTLFIRGFLIGLIMMLPKHSSSEYAKYMYCIVIPAIITFVRIDYFGTTVFLIPFFSLCLLYFIDSANVRKRNQYDFN